MDLEHWIQKQCKAHVGSGYRSATPGRKRHKPFDVTVRRRPPKKGKRAA